MASVELDVLAGGRPDRRPPHPTLLDCTFDELGALLAAEGQPAYRARQLFGALHGRTIADWDQASDLPARLRASLAERYRLAAGELAVEAVSSDGTRKRLLRLWDGQEIETVAIPSTSPQGHHRVSVCVSTQAGCAMACTFCATGMMGFSRHLTPGEIVDQVYTFARGAQVGQRPTHVVFMGMGEPLANYEATLKAVRLLTDPQGLGLSQRRITVSTSGLVPEIERLAGESLEITLAISLHAPNDTLRSSLMPINRRYPLAELIRAASDYAERTGRRVSYEYVMLRGVNDSPREAAELVRLLPRRLSHVNLIPYNPTGAAFSSTDRERARALLAQLQAAGLSATIRASRGRDVAAACGQLRAENRRRSAGDQAHGQIEQPGQEGADRDGDDPGGDHLASNFPANRPRLPGRANPQD
jgi:23S rRNA (adenine2503-C2)-methyltransferase